MTCRRADVVLNTPVGGWIEFADEACQQLRQIAREPLQQPDGRVEPHLVRALWENQKRYKDRDYAASSHFSRARDRRFDWALAESSRDQKHQHRREWRDPEVRIEGSEQRQRCNDQRQDAGLRQRRSVRNQNADNGRIDGAADRADG
jgi:hypothetical protein